MTEIIIAVKIAQLCLLYLSVNIQIKNQNANKMSWAINWIEPQSSSKTVADEYKVGFMKLWNLTNWRGKQK